MASNFQDPQYAIRDTRYAIPETSVIVLNWNGALLLPECLGALAGQRYRDFELIVVDNGSTDGTVEYLRTCDDVKLIANFENRGFPAAVNQGMLAAKGDTILLLNNDTMVTSGWLGGMIYMLDMNRAPTQAM